jgi:heme a synthase
VNDEADPVGAGHADISAADPGRPTPAFARSAVAVTGFVLLLVAMGGLVRATDSGLACPDWPRCFGMWVPPADLNVWLEHSHRLLAGIGGLAIIALAVWSWRRYRHRPDLVWPATVAAGVVVIQSGLGALVVLRLLPPALVAIHLGVAALLFAALAMLAVNSIQPLTAL